MKSSFALLLILLSITHVTSAETISFTSGPFNASTEIAADTSGSFGNSFPVDVTGLSQFDPSLGILTDVTFNVLSGEFSWNLEIAGDPLTNEFEGIYTAEVQGDLLYQSGMSFLVLEGVVDSIEGFCAGDQSFGDFCFDANGNNLDYEFDSFDVDRDLSEFDLADIIGTGDVTNLSLDVVLFNESFDEVTEFAFLEVFGIAEITNAVVEVTYEFTAVPVPAAVWLFGSAILGLAGLARRKSA